MLQVLAVAVNTATLHDTRGITATVAWRLPSDRIEPLSVPSAQVISIPSTCGRLMLQQ